MSHPQNSRNTWVPEVMRGLGTMGKRQVRRLWAGGKRLRAGQSPGLGDKECFVLGLQGRVRAGGVGRWRWLL